MRPVRPIGIPPCPEPDAWARFAAGICGPDEQAALLEHAANCTPCAGRLRDLLAAAQDEPLESPDARVTDSLAIQSPDQRRKLAQAMARRKGLLPGKWWIPIAAVLVIGLGIGVGLLTREMGAPPLRQLAQAYSARRNLELQIPGAPYAPIRIERGGGSSLGDLPPALLESQLRIKQHLDRNPGDPAWLHAQGRTALLLWDFDAALRSFQTAADLGAKSPDFLTDFATAYFERAERNGAAIDYALSLEKLGQALQQDPANLPALFNRAIVRGKLAQFDPAIADLEDYLRREPDPGWREEARRLMERLRNSRAGLFERGRPPSPGLRAELAMEAAMTTGLTAYFRQRSPELESQAAALAVEHQDPWLLETTGLRDNPNLERAVAAIGELAKLRALAGGGYDRLTVEIQFLETAGLPLPLRVWRDYELLYHTARTMAVANCGDTAALRQAARRYPWFEAQILLESSLCAAGRQDFTEAAALVDEASRIAEAHRFAATLIRVPNFRGQRLVETGFCREAIQTATEALAKLEAGGYPLRRAYDFHVIVLKSAANLNLPHTAYGAASMMAAVGRASGARMFEMIGESQKAQFALALGKPEAAAQAYQAAEAAFHGLGGNADGELYWRVARTGWMELHRDRDALYRMLREARSSEASGKENLYFNRRIIAALCRLELQAGNPRAVEGLAEPFWREAAETASFKPGAARAYLPELEAISRAQTHARLLAGDAESALASWRRFLGLQQRLLGGREPAPERPRAAPGSAILTVAELDGRAASWLTTAEHTQFHWAAASYPELVESVRRLRRLASLATVPEPQIEGEARRLYATLFPAGAGGARRVYLEARGELNSLPLALFSGIGEGRDLEFSFLPLGGGAPSLSPVLDRVTIIAATRFNSTLGVPAGPLPSLDEEIGAVGVAFPGRSLLRGEAATARAVEDAALSHGVLHFAGHAVPWHGGIGLAVAPDASDPASDGQAGIWSMARPRLMNASLAVFSACRTGEFNEPGSVRPGQLSEAALLAGARAVVATLWDVDSLATVAWMKEFYAQLAAGRPVAAATSRASLALRSQPAWHHPRYWAGFAAYARGAAADPVTEAARGTSDFH